MSFDPTTRSVSEEMSTDVVWLQPEDTVLDALSLMEREHVTALPVVDENECCVGIVSATDLVKAAREVVELLNAVAACDEEQKREVLIQRLVKNGFATSKVSDVMRQPAMNVRQDASIVKAGRKMLRWRIHHLPVKDEQSQLVGIVSTMDLLAAFMKATTKNAEQTVESA